MNRIEKLTDLSVWTGNWPFMHYRYGELEALKEKLQSLNITKAYVAPMEAILEQDPTRANKSLLNRINSDFFSPVVVVDLSYENWQELMLIAANDGRVEMVKLIPNYHIYNLDNCKIGKFVELAGQNNMVVSIQMRVEDKRGQYPLMRVDDVQVHEVVRTLSCFPDQIFVLNNVLLHEIQIIFGSLNNVYIDISSLERQDILEYLDNAYTLDRFVFSSHSPFFYPEGSLYKLMYSNVNMDGIEKVAYKNAAKILKQG